jgi:hypothetical protein
MNDFSYEVIAVRHEEGDRSKIICYKLKNLLQGGISPTFSVMERMDIFIRIQAKISFGIRENPSDNNLVPVIAENINGHLYIKTIPNGIAEDNLGNLPEF